MENQLNTPMEGEQQPKIATDVVSNVLDKNTKNNQFLHNVGIEIVPQRRRSLHVVEAKLAVDKRASAELRSVVDS
jgi:hypothetical protein